MNTQKPKKSVRIFAAISVILLLFIGWYIYSSGIFGSSVTSDLSESRITDEQRLAEYEGYGITYDEDSQSYLYQGTLIKDLSDGDFRYTNSAGTIELIIQRTKNGSIQRIDTE